MHFSKPPMGTPLDWENPLNKGTVLALAMNEGHGDKVQDLSMNGNHGTLNNFAFPSTTTSGWNPGQTGVGLNWDGTNDYIDCGNNVDPNTANTITIGAIFNSSDLVGNKFLIAKSANVFFRTEEDELAIGLNIGGIKYAKSTGVDFVVNRWHDVKMTYNKDAGDNVIHLYVNGNEVSYSQQDNTGGGAILLGADTWKIGVRGMVETYFNGSIDQPRIQSRAWSAKEVKDYAINPWQVYLDDGGM